jgi:hypothetical protein
MTFSSTTHPLNSTLSSTTFRDDWSTKIKTIDLQETSSWVKLFQQVEGKFSAPRGKVWPVVRWLTGSVARADLERELLCVILTTRPASEDEGFLLRRVSNVVQSAVEQ